MTLPHFLRLSSGPMGLRGLGFCGVTGLAQLVQSDAGPGRLIWGPLVTRGCPGKRSRAGFRVATKVTRENKQPLLPSQIRFHGRRQSSQGGTQQVPAVPERGDVGRCLSTKGLVFPRQLSYTGQGAHFAQSALAPPPSRQLALSPLRLPGQGHSASLRPQSRTESPPSGPPDSAVRYKCPGGWYTPSGAPWGVFWPMICEQSSDRAPPGQGIFLTGQELPESAPCCHSEMVAAPSGRSQGP